MANKIKFIGVKRRAPVHGSQVATASYSGKFDLEAAQKKVKEFQKEARRRNEPGENIS